jgi:hypothetical protein
MAPLLSCPLPESTKGGFETHPYEDHTLSSALKNCGLMPNPFRKRLERLERAEYHFVASP